MNSLVEEIGYIPIESPGTTSPISLSMLLNFHMRKSCLGSTLLKCKNNMLWSILPWGDHSVGFCSCTARKCLNNRRNKASCKAWDPSRTRKVWIWVLHSTRTEWGTGDPPQMGLRRKEELERRDKRVERKSFVYFSICSCDQLWASWRENLTKHHKVWTKTLKHIHRRVFF